MVRFLGNSEILSINIHPHTHMWGWGFPTVKEEMTCILSCVLRHASILNALESGIRKTEQKWKSETQKHDQKSQFVPLPKIIRASQSMQSGRIIHLLLFACLFLIYIQSKSKRDSKTLDYICFLIVFDSIMNPDWILTRFWFNPDSSFFIWCRA